MRICFGLRKVRRSFGLVGFVFLRFCVGLKLLCLVVWLSFVLVSSLLRLRNLIFLLDYFVWGFWIIILRIISLCLDKFLKLISFIVVFLYRIWVRVGFSNNSSRFIMMGIFIISLFWVGFLLLIGLLWFLGCLRILSIRFIVICLIFSIFSFVRDRLSVLRLFLSFKFWVMIFLCFLSWLIGLVLLWVLIVFFVILIGIVMV